MENPRPSKQVIERVDDRALTRVRRADQERHAGRLRRTMDEDVAQCGRQLALVNRATVSPEDLIHNGFVGARSCGVRAFLRRVLPNHVPIANPLQLCVRGRRFPLYGILDVHTEPPLVLIGIRLHGHSPVLLHIGDEAVLRAQALRDH